MIVGGGAAGDSAAAALRREGYGGPITVVDGDADAPYDRPNCSKDYLAGNAPEDWLPLRPPEFDRDQEIERLSGRAGDRARSGGAGGSPGRRKHAGTMVRCCSRPAPRRSGSCRPRSTRRPPVLLSPHPRRQPCDHRRGGQARGAPSCSAPASSAWKWRPRSARAGSKCSVVAPDRVPLGRVLGPELGELRAHGCTRSTGSCSTWAEADGVDAGAVTLDDGSGSRPTSWSPASACGPTSSWPRPPG